VKEIYSIYKNGRIKLRHMKRKNPLFYVAVELVKVIFALALFYVILVLFLSCDASPMNGVGI